MNTGNIIPKPNSEVSTVVKVDKVSEDRWAKVKEKASRDGAMMLFDTYRVSLGGADAGWGTKVFKKAIIDIGFVEECSKEAGQKGTFCPTANALDKYPALFHYDPETNIWGLNNSNIHIFDEDILPTLVTMAVDVRAFIKEAKKRRQQARYIENKQGKSKKLF